MVISGHCGNWELLLAFAPILKGTFYGVARKQNNPYINKLIVSARERHGANIIYKKGALRAFIKQLKAGNVVGVAMDQGVLPSEGILIDFLGAPAWTTRMPAAIAKRTGAEIAPVFMRREPDGSSVLTILPSPKLTGDEVQDTKLMSSYIEDYIRKNPTQWLWIHRRWKRADPASLEAMDNPPSA